MLTSAYTQAHREAAKEWVLTWSMAVYRAQAHGNVLPPPFNGLMILLHITGASFEMRQRVQLIRQAQRARRTSGRPAPET